jgi:hypothetical protein
MEKDQEINIQQELIIDKRKKGTKIERKKQFPVRDSNALKRNHQNKKSR